ncbi:uncharacterized protein N7469_011679 [Penicillium citrinum]|uniref:Subtelomeric hrmA-associated cluster protein AFUB-079030/YDR124W-like helical bundle domain-containing protein n=1 Tax=Penicillium citrinum TaxID=5077 RepID=A0A9W9N8G0_PENCI|nr:uncharacterized protein N7469_011679 [Penicillium citrinum]KAJ5215188.1 hypothetical protein N7469_011679 [Penicillium citrinum]
MSSSTPQLVDLAPWYLLILYFNLASSLMANPAQVPTSMSMQNQHNTPEHLAYPHFALICIDHQGNLRHVTSLSVANSRESILSPLMTVEFLRAVQRSSGAAPSYSQSELGVSSSFHGATSGQAAVPNQINNLYPFADERDPQGHTRSLISRAPSVQSALWSASQGPESWSHWPGHSQNPQPQQQLWNSEPSIRTNQKAFISVRDRDFLRRYYEKVFKNLQQTNCRVLAKAYVKLIEPRKQVNFPYNGRKVVAGKTQQLDPDDTKPPPGGPLELATESQTIFQKQRVRLLVHIFCESRTNYGITARKLRAADQPIRRQILPVERLEVLDEAYQVREEEEKFLDGVTDGKAMLSISRSNLPDAAETLVNCCERKQKPAPVEEDSGPEQKTETSPVVDGPLEAKPSPPIFVPYKDVPSNPSPTPSPTRYIHQDLPIHPGFDHASVSNSPQMKRKRQNLDLDLDSLITLNSTTTGYYSPIFVRSQSFTTEPYAYLHGFPPQGVLPGQPVPELPSESMEKHRSPYEFYN